MTNTPQTERLYTTSFSDGLRVETRSLADGSRARVIGGLAAVFGKRSHPMGGVREVVSSSFFNKSQADGWPMAVARFEHDKLMLLGTHASGTLALNITRDGLDYSVRLPETRSDVYELAERGDLPGSSFSFQSYQDDWRLGDGGYPERHLVSGRLIDVAPTAVPAYPDSTVRVAYRSLATRFDVDPDEVEQYAQSGRLPEFFGTRKAVVIDAKPEARNHDLDILQRRSQLRARKLACDAPPLTTEQRLLQLRRRKLAWHEQPVEARSHTDDFRQDGYGHAADWHPWQR
jgi:HK97 family phage prohead protease